MATSIICRHVRSVMFSSHPQKLRQYYVDRGLVFREMHLGGKKHYLAKNQRLAILDVKDYHNMKDCLGGLAIYTPSQEESISYKFTCWDNKNLFFGFFQFDENNLADFSTNDSYLLDQPRWVHILRSENIEKAKDFYCDIGQWESEKHGGGPKHYSFSEENHVFSEENHVFELYPLRKSGYAGIEYIASSNIYLGLQYDPEGRMVQFLNL